MTPALAKVDLLTPIPGDNPSGVSLRYDPVYDQIREARRIVVDHSGAISGPEHDIIVELAGEALAARSKDLQLAVWLTDAMIGVRGFAGLSDSLALLKGLIENFWDTFYPLIEDGDAYDRIALLEWVGGYYEARNSSPVRSLHLCAVAHGYDWDRYQNMVAGKSDAAEFETVLDATPKAFYKERLPQITESLARVKELERVTDERFGREGPSFSKLRGLLEEMEKSFQGLLRRKLEKDPDPVEAPPPTAAAEAGVEAAAPTFSAIELDTSTVYGAIAAAAHQLRRSSPSNPSSYLVLRGLRWGELRAHGAEIPPQALVAPPTEFRTQLRSLAAAGAWAQVLELAEQAMATECGRAWLDIQRYTVTACENLGYSAAARAIRSELRTLMRDYPELANATLLDDTGAANPATSAWLKTVTQRED